MTLIKQWALGLVIASVAGALALIISPQGAVEKQVRTAVSLFLLVAFMSPFVSEFDFDDLFSYQSVSAYDGSSQISNNIAKKFESDIKNRINNLLSKNGIEANKINIDVIITDNNEMKLEKAVVVVKNGINDAEVKHLIKENLGLVVEIEVEE